MDKKLIEFVGRNWLAAQLWKAGIEVARPERDRGIDLIAYLDSDKRGFTAVPIQVKAFSKCGFRLEEKYLKFAGLILVYVWNLENSSDTKCYALTYSEAYQLVKKRKFKNGELFINKPSKSLCEQLANKYEMNPERWQDKLTGELERFTNGRDQS